MRAADVKRRKADGTRWLHPAGAARALPVCESTVHKWVSAGVVRAEVNAGGHWVCVDDVLDLLATVPRKDGRMRTPEEQRAKKAIAQKRLNATSIDTADRRGEEWSHEDALLACDPDRGVTDAELAVILGRTVDAILAKRTALEGTPLHAYRDEMEGSLAASFGWRFARAEL